jgi:carboxyl-terminal processing protease
VRITQFQEETTTELTKALDKLTKDNKENLKGLVLDLRNDPGCLLNSAVGVSAAFLPPKALVVSTDGRTDDSKRKFLAIPEDYQRGRGEDALRGLPSNSRELPLIVLVNGGSASASEIVAGALQDHKRAVIAGTQTFGKGSVQSVLPLSANTAIKLTTARYFTPSGRSIQAKGITPDVVIEETPNGTQRTRFKEADLEHHLDNGDAAKDADKPKSGKSDKTDKPRAKGSVDTEDELMKPLEFASKDDYQLTQAMNLLKAWQIMKRN